MCEFVTDLRKMTFDYFLIYYTLANNALQPTCMPPKHIYVRETLSPVQKV